MATQDRRHRQFVEREQLFLIKASELIKKDGLLKLQMQRVAEASEYSVGTLYHHFKSKEDMLLALVTKRVGDRLIFFEKVSKWQACSRDRMLGLIFADILFAQREPLFFQLQQYLSTPVIAAAITPERRDIAIKAHQPLADLFMAVIDEAVAVGDVKCVQISAQQLGLGLWALGEGMHTLVHADGLLEAYRISSAYTLLLHHAQALLNGHNWLPLYPLDDIDRHKALFDRLVREVFTDVSVTEIELFITKDKQALL